MKRYDLRTVGLALLLATIAGSAHGFEIDQFVIAGGGAMSTTGGPFELSGTIGQHDAGGPKTAGPFASSSGFWVDACPGDTNKLEPGVCGCGVSDVDTDGDGTPDCNDGCPNDPEKIDPGVCGCGVPDDDLDGNGIIDCLEGPTAPQPTPGCCAPGVFPMVGFFTPGFLIGWRLRRRSSRRGRPADLRYPGK